MIPFIHNSKEYKLIYRDKKQISNGLERDGGDEQRERLRRSTRKLLGVMHMFINSSPNFIEI